MSGHNIATPRSTTDPRAGHIVRQFFDFYTGKVSAGAAVSGLTFALMFTYALVNDLGLGRPESSVADECVAGSVLLLVVLPLLYILYERRYGFSLAALSHKNPSVRTRAARALAGVRELPEVRPLAAALRDENVHVRLNVAFALGEIGDRRAVGLLVARLDDPDLEVRRAVVEALGKIGDPRAVAPLLKGLRYADVRPATGGALRAIGAPAVAPLFNAMRGADEHLRGYIAGLLVEFGRPTSELMADALKEQDGYTRLNAGLILWKMGDPLPAAKAVVPLLADERLHAQAEDALERIGAPAVEPLIAELRNASERVRHGAISVLGRLRDRRAAGPLATMLGDGRERTRFKAVTALGKIGGEETVAPLISAARDESARVREVAVEALGGSGDARAVEPLIHALNDEDVKVRMGAALSLGLIGDARAVGPLILGLKDKSLKVRGRCVEALTGFDSEDTVGPLVAALRLEELRSGAADALTKIGGPAVEQVIPLLKDERPRVRSRAAVILGNIGDPRAIGPLTSAQDDKDLYVRWSVAEALKKFGNSETCDYDHEPVGKH